MLSNIIYDKYANVNMSERRFGMQANKEIRDYARIKNVRLWMIADRLNMRDSNFSRVLRHELSSDKRNEIKKIIDELAEAGE